MCSHWKIKNGDPQFFLCSTVTSDPSYHFVKFLCLICISSILNGIFKKPCFEQQILITNTECKRHPYMFLWSFQYRVATLICFNFSWLFALFGFFSRQFWVNFPDFLRILTHISSKQPPLQQILLLYRTKSLMEQVVLPWFNKNIC